MNYTIEVYTTETGKVPFNRWLTSLADMKGRQKFRIRLQRLSLGNFGNCKGLKKGIRELKIDFGAGYRVYFTKIVDNKILVLWGGTKRTQRKDIEKAAKYLKNFKLREKDGTKQKT